jgi:hypothetical protein
MPAQQVMGPASVYDTLSLTARCDDVQCCLHGTFVIVVGNDDLGQKLNPNRLPCAKVLGNSRAASVMSAARCSLKPLTELTTIWLDNIMNGVPPGDETGCSLFVIVPRHGRSATRHSITFIGEVLFLFSV